MVLTVGGTVRHGAVVTPPTLEADAASITVAGPVSRAVQWAQRDAVGGVEAQKVIVGITE